MSLARRLLEFRFKGIFWVEVKSFAKFTFGRKSSGVITLSEWTFEEFKSGTVNYPCPKFRKIFSSFRLDTSSKIITLGSVCWMGRSEHWRGSPKIRLLGVTFPLNPSPCCRINRCNPLELVNHYPRAESNLLTPFSRLSRNVCIHYPMKATTTMPTRLSSYRLRSPSRRHILVVFRGIVESLYFLTIRQDLRLPFGKGIECSKNSRLGRCCGCGGVGDSSFAKGFLVVLNCVLEFHDGFSGIGDLRLKPKESGTSSIIAWIVSESV